MAFRRTDASVLLIFRSWGCKTHQRLPVPTALCCPENWVGGESGQAATGAPSVCRRSLWLPDRPRPLAWSPCPFGAPALSSVTELVVRSLQRPSPGPGQAWGHASAERRRHRRDPGPGGVSPASAGAQKRLVQHSPGVLLAQVRGGGSLAPRPTSLSPLGGHSPLQVMGTRKE